MARIVGWVLPDGFRRGLRLAIAIFVPCLLGLGVIGPEHWVWSDSFRSAMLWCAITTAVVNSPVLGKVSLVGTERSIGTILGGLIGFLLFTIGSLFWDESSDGVVLACGASIVAFFSVVLGDLVKLDTSARLFIITFLLVIFGGDQGSDPFNLFVTRVGGILAGVLLMAFLSATVFQKSASMECLKDIAAALSALRSLSDVVWEEGMGGGGGGGEPGQPAGGGDSRVDGVAHARPAGLPASSSLASLQGEHGRAAGGGGGGGGGNGAGGGPRGSARGGAGWRPNADLEAQLLADAGRAGGGGGADGPEALPLLGRDSLEARPHPPPHKAIFWWRRGRPPAPPARPIPPHLSAEDEAIREREDAFEEKCEELVTKVYASCFRANENAGFGANEVLMIVMHGHPVFAPGLPTRLSRRGGRDHLPWGDLTAAATGVRRVSRLLFQLSSALQRGFLDDLREMLGDRFPEAALRGAAAGARGAVAALAEAFPDSRRRPRPEPLLALADAVADLGRASDFQRRPILTALKSHRGRDVGGGARWTRLIDDVIATTPTRTVREGRPEEGREHLARSAPAPSALWGPGLPAPRPGVFGIRSGTSPRAAGASEPPSQFATFAPTVPAAEPAGRGGAAAAAVPPGAEGPHGDPLGATASAEPAERAPSLAAPSTRPPSPDEPPFQFDTSRASPRAGDGGPDVAPPSPRSSTSRPLAPVGRQTSLPRFQRAGSAASSSAAAANAIGRSSFAAAARNEAVPGLASVVPRASGGPGLDAAALRAHDAAVAARFDAHGARASSGLRGFDAAAAHRAPPGQGGDEALGRPPPVSGEAPWREGAWRPPYAAAAPAARPHRESDAVPSHVALFPETPAGRVAQVRWYTFQFLVNELTEELADLHLVLSGVLTQVPW